MEVGADPVRVVGHDLNQFTRHLGGLDAGQANTKVALQFDKFSNEVCEANPFGFGLPTIEVDPKVAKMDSRQDHFPIAPVDHATHFVHDMFGGTAVHLGSDVRDDAVAAPQ